MAILDKQGLPVHFCKTNLPKRDEMITLIDEDGDEFPTLFLARKTGLSGGWRGFAIAHKLADGDALVFQLIKRTAFKVIKHWSLVLFNTFIMFNYVNGTYEWWKEQKKLLVMWLIIKSLTFQNCAGIFQSMCCGYL